MFRDMIAQVRRYKRTPDGDKSLQYISIYSLRFSREQTPTLVSQRSACFLKKPISVNLFRKYKVVKGDKGGATGRNLPPRKDTATAGEV